MTKRILSTLGVSTLVISLFVWATPAFSADEKKNDEETYRLLALFGDVFERVRAEYVEAPSEEKMIEAAITGMLAAMDWSSMLSRSSSAC